MISRDYLSVKLWDLRNERAPVRTFKVYFVDRRALLFLLGKLLPNMENLC